MALDNKPLRSINIQFPLKNSSRGSFETNDETVRSISDNLKILILTNWGERPLNYRFGANLRPIIFEQGPDVNQQIIDAILVAINRWMPRVNVLDVKVFRNEDNPSVGLNEVKVEVKFSVGNTELSGDVAVNVRSY